jgi:hypothetical protein
VRRRPPRPRREPNPQFVNEVASLRPRYRPWCESDLILQISREEERLPVRASRACSTFEVCRRVFADGVASGEGREVVLEAAREEVEEGE